MICLLRFGIRIISSTESKLESSQNKLFNLWIIGSFKKVHKFNKYFLNTYCVLGTNPVGSSHKSVWELISECGVDGFRQHFSDLLVGNEIYFMGQNHHQKCLCGGNFTRVEQNISECITPAKTFGIYLYQNIYIYVMVWVKL